jgi:hypothetical protein
LESSSGDTIAVEIKRTLSPKLTPAFVESMGTLGAARGYYIMPVGESYPLSPKVGAVSLLEFLHQIKNQ